MSKNQVILYLGLALIIICQVGCGSNAQSPESESQAATLDEQLVEAFSDDDLDRMTSLLEEGADPNAESAPGRPVLFQAALQGKSEAARLLIDQGADVHAETVDGAILVKAALQGHPEIVEMLLDAGAEVNAPGKWGAMEVTSIFAATIADDDGIVEMLINHGADLNQTAPDGASPLCIAAGAFPNTESVSLLAENGANINHQTSTGETPLHFAVSKGIVSNSFDTEIVRILIDHGADMTIENEQGQTPLDLAGPDTEIGKILREAGAGE